jgi:hypothetical protein
MTAREAYFKAYIHSNKQLGMLFYTFNQNGTERIGNTQWMVFDKEDHEYNIGAMEYIEKNIKGFMFWNMSDEGAKFFETNAKEISRVLAQVIINQK